MITEIALSLLLGALAGAITGGSIGLFFAYIAKRTTKCNQMQQDFGEFKRTLAQHRSRIVPTYSKGGPIPPSPGLSGEVSDETP